MATAKRVPDGRRLGRLVWKRRSKTWRKEAGRRVRKAARLAVVEAAARVIAVAHGEYRGWFTPRSEQVVREPGWRGRWLMTRNVKGSRRVD